MKRLLSVLLSLVITFSVIPMELFSIKAGYYNYTYGYLTYSIYDEEIRIIDCDPSATGTINIPAEINGYSVTGITYSAFKGCKNLTSINIPDSVTTIAETAFRGCINLKSIYIPDSVTYIDYAAFFSCSNLTTINIPNNLTTIEGATFYGCKNLVNVNIPNSVTSIGGSAFCGCTSLTSINIPDSVTYIGDNAFYDCDNLVIKCKSGSYAESYAKENNIPFESNEINSELMYDIIANDYPQYLNNAEIDFYYDNLNRQCYDVIEEYDNNTNGILAFAECFVNGTEILTKEILSKLGLSQSLEEKWLEDNALEFARVFSGNAEIANGIWKEVEDEYKKFKFVYDESTAIAKQNLVTALAEVQKDLSYNTLTDYVDSVLENDVVMEKFDNSFDTADDVVDVVDTVLYTCQLYSLEKKSLTKLISLIEKDTPLYEGLTNLLNDMTVNPGLYMVDKYLNDKAVDYIIEGLEDALLSSSVGLTHKLVTLASSFIYDYLYQGAKIDEVYGAIIAYDFYTTINISLNDMILKLTQHKLNGTEPNDELLENYKFIFNAKRLSAKHYLDSCINISKYQDEINNLENIKETLDNDKHFDFDNYIQNHCYKKLLSDIESGTVECLHGYSYLNNTVSPTCTNNGYSNLYCKICENTFKADYTQALGHSYNHTVTAPSCVNQGYTSHQCIRCSYNYRDNYINALGHSYSHTVTAPTCVNQGYTTHLCTSCKYTYVSDYTPLTEHSYINGFCDCGIGKGICGEDASWKFSTNGVLSISGYKQIGDFSQNNAPWYAKRASIKNIILSQGITSIGKNTFYGCSSLENITIPFSVTAIDKDAFSNCNDFTIQCHYASFAKAYAIANNINYSLIRVDFDASGDGNVNVIDLISIKRKLLTSYDISPDGDCNDDGIIDIRDLLSLKNHLLYS